MRIRKPNKGIFHVSAAQCPTCKTIIISGHHHDFHSCPCGEIAIDGGREYVRMAYRKVTPTVIQIECIGIKPHNLANEAYEESNAIYHNQTHASSTEHRVVPRRVLTTIKTNHTVDPNRYIYTLNKKGKMYRYEQEFPAPTVPKPEPEFDNIGRDI
jgi:hypothetical protein